MKRNRTTVVALLVLGGVMVFSSIGTAGDETRPKEDTAQGQEGVERTRVGIPSIPG